ncbi:MAG TPA: hypothetical protein VMX56_02575, partial [Anaerolineales bacterium]|nr:hypothetical protein [Anaerolineales bacterium]
MNPNLILIVCGGLGLLLLVVGLGLTLFGERSVVEERLGRYTEGGQVVVARQDSDDRRPRTTFITDLLTRLGEGSDLFDKIARNLAQADLKFR